MSVTMEPESNKDGTFRPRNSMVMDRHCETALCKICCLVSLNMALLVKVLTICSNLSSNLVSEGGSDLAPPLHPRPWEAGSVSLTPPSSFLDCLGNDVLASSLTGQFSEEMTHIFTIPGKTLLGL